jgi:glutamate carboxypeptidase
MDTVYPKEHSFQKWHWLDEERLCGPGSADMKGGLVVLLYALKALELCPIASHLGWQLLLTPDEEIGSLGSVELLQKLATTAQIGLVFEPSLANGALVSRRKASAKVTLVAKGVAAHAGRDFDQGRNAIVALSDLIVRIHQLNQNSQGVTINAGVISGGSVENVVPSRAVCKVDLRSPTTPLMLETIETIKRLLQEMETLYDLSIEMHTLFTRPAKPFDAPLPYLFQQLQLCGKELGISLSWKESGGVCEGNTLTAAGLPTIDSMGVRGDKIHSSDEFCYVDSLVERSQLTALFLMKIANGEIRV